MDHSSLQFSLYSVPVSSNNNGFDLAFW